MGTKKVCRYNFTPAIASFPGWRLILNMQTFPSFDKQNALRYK